MKIYLLILLLLISGCTTTSKEGHTPPSIDMDKFGKLLERNATNTNILQQNHIVKTYKYYLKKKNHKAFAYSESGSWAYRTDYIDVDKAIKAALGGCELYNKRYQAEQPCKIVNIDGFWASEFFDDKSQ